MNEPRKIALVHDWLVRMRGGEKCLEVLCELFPEARVFTIVHRKGALAPAIERMPITTSFIQNLPFGVAHYQRYLPLLPRAIEQFDLSSFDLVISSSHAVAKGVHTGPQTLHVCYCHTPMRYIWDQYENYFGEGRAGLPTRTAMRFFLPYFRRWDVETSSRVTYFIANSRNVQERIRRLYNRGSEVIHPPVDVSRFRLSAENDGYYLIVSALVPYKRIDIAVETFNRLGQPLVIVGTGSEMQRLRRMANSNIRFAGWLDDAAVAEHYRRCRALIFPGEEDFGIVPVEAMASGKPVIAFARGGALETIVEMDEFATGVFFYEQTSDSLLDAIRRFNARSFDPNRLHAHATQFDRLIYQTQMKSFISNAWANRTGMIH